MSTSATRRPPRADAARRADATEAVVVRGVERIFTGAKGATVTALTGIDLTVADGEFVSLIGPSGCGKSTLLRLIADLDEPTAGDIRVFGKTARQARIDQEYGIAFQQAGLLPWRTVAANIELPLQLHGVGARRAPGARRRSCSTSSGSPTSRSTTPTSSPAACSSAWRSPARSPSSRGCCSWTSRSARSTR